MLRNLAFASALCALPLTAMAAEAPATPPATISVSGTGEVSVAPDMATLRIAVTTQATSAEKAVAANSKAAQKVIEEIKARKIGAKDIQTSSFSVSPVYADTNEDQRNDPPQVVAYRASNQVIVEVHELDALGSLLDAVVTSGANRISGLSFGIEDDSAITDKARTQAVEDARHKAELLAEAAGVSLGRVLSITESGGRPMPMMARSFSALAAAAPVPPIEQGEMTLTANVHIVWEIEQATK